MKVSRRDFLKISAGAGAAATFMNKDVLQKAMALIVQNTYATNLVWIHGQNCTGCSISALQWCGAVPNDIINARTGSTLPADGLTYTTNLVQVLANTATDLEFHPTLMPQAGAYYSGNGMDYTPYGAAFTEGAREDLTYVDAIEWLKTVVNDTSEQTFVIVEGSIPYEKWGDNEYQGFCEVGMKDLGGGTYKEGHMWNFASIVEYCHDAPGVAAFIAYGNCGAFGGIPGGNPNPTGAKGLMHFLEDVYGMGGHKPVINITDCPAHPEHLVFTYAAVLWGLAQASDPLAYVRLDQWNRPTQVYIEDVGWVTMFAEQVHNDCERIASFEAGDFATTFEEAINNPSKCLLRLGCRGVSSHTNCSNKRGGTVGPAPSGWNPAGVGIWNNDMNNPITAEQNPGSWCVAQGSPCYGCSQTTFPDNVFGKGFFIESTHSEFLAAGQIPGSASGATPEYEGKGVACYTCHAVRMPRSNKEWIDPGAPGYGSGYNYP